MNLQVAITDIAECQKEVSIEIEAGEVKEEYKKAYDAYARYAKVPGFRQGNVPKSIVKQRFAKEIKGEVVQQIIPHALGHVIEDHKLKIIGSPEVNPDEIEVREGEPLKFKARIEVLPDFELKEYKGLKLTKRISRVTDEKVEQVVNELHEGAAQLIPVEDRTSQLGDFVSVNLTGKYVEPAGEEDLSTDDLVIELGGEGVHEAFNENLTGVREGDVRHFTVKYPEDFPAPNLANKTLDFSATVNSVKSKELPELDDEFVQEIAEEYKESYKTLPELREKLRADLTTQAETEAHSGLRESLLEKLVVGYEFSLPKSLIERQTNSRVADFIQRLYRSGISPQAARQINWEERQAEEAKRAENDVRIALILGAIAETEKIVVTREDLDQEIERIATMMGESPDEIEARLTKEGSLSSIENRLRSDKVLNYLISQAEITTEEYDEKPVSEQVAPETSESEKAEGASEGT